MPAKPALLLRSTPVPEGDSALVRVLEASIETSEGRERDPEAPACRRRGAGGAREREGGRGDRRAKSAHAAQDVGGLPVTAARGISAAAERARPWWRRLAG